jgi:hypothetical protein
MAAYNKTSCDPFFIPDSNKIFAGSLLIATSLRNRRVASRRESVFGWATHDLFGIRQCGFDALLAAYGGSFVLSQYFIKLKGAVNRSTLLEASGTRKDQTKVWRCSACTTQVLHVWAQVGDKSGRILIVFPFDDSASMSRK